MTDLMKAIQVSHYGGPDVLKIEHIPRPEPQTMEILVRVYAAGVLPMDCYTRSGSMASIMPKSFPYTPGTTFAGVIEKTGPGVTDWQVGQAVCGRAPGGTYAEYVTIQTNPPTFTPDTIGYRNTSFISPLALKPETLSFEEAAALSGGATTAWTSLFEDGNLQAGQTILIHGAAGGVGLFAVQFAKWKGAHVIGTTSTANLDFVHSLGAEKVIDYTTTHFEDVVHDIDFVLDTIGGETLQRSLRILKRGGTLVTIVEPAPTAQAEKLDIHAIKNAVFPTSEHLQKIVQIIDKGYARPFIQKVFSLDEASLAHELCETRHGRGRIILRPL